MPSERRLFVGIFPPAGIAERVHAAARETLAAQDFRLVPADEIHLTLRFLGATPEAAIEGLLARFRQDVGRSRAPELRIRGTGAFPDAGEARVLWAGIVDAGGRLARLAAAVGEEKPYRPHLTVARCRNARAPAAFLDLEIDLPWAPEEVLLVESRPGATGPDRFPRIEAFRLSTESR